MSAEWADVALRQPIVHALLTPNESHQHCAGLQPFHATIEFETSSGGKSLELCDSLSSLLQQFQLLLMPPTPVLPADSLFEIGSFPLQKFAVAFHLFVPSAQRAKAVFLFCFC